MWNRNIIFLSLIMALYSSNALSQTAVKEFTDSIPLSKNMSVTINSKKGNIEIIRWEKPWLWLRVKFTFSNDNPVIAKQELQYGKYSLLKSSNGVTITNFFTFPENTNKVQSIIRIDYKIYLPDKVSLIINNEYGICSLSNLSGFININNKYGEIYLNRISGKVRIYSTLCDIHANNISGITELHGTNSNFFLKNINGEIFINNDVGSIQIESGQELDQLKISASYSDIGLAIYDIKRFNYNIKAKNAKIELSQKFNNIPFTLKSKESILYKSAQITRNIEIMTSNNNIKLL